MKFKFAATKQNVSTQMTGEDIHSLTLVSTDGAAAHTVQPRTHTALQLLDFDYPELTESAPPHTPNTTQTPDCAYPQLPNSSLTHPPTTPHLHNCNDRDCRRCSRFWDQSLDQLNANLRAPDANHPRSRKIVPVPDVSVRFLRSHTSILIDNQASGTSSDSESSVRLPQHIDDQASGRNERALELERQAQIRQKNQKILFSMAQLFVGARSRGRYIYRPTRERAYSVSEDFGRRKRSGDDKHEQLARVVNCVAWFMVVLYLFTWSIRATQW